MESNLGHVDTVVPCRDTRFDINGVVEGQITTAKLGFRSLALRRSEGTARSSHRGNFTIIKSFDS